MMKKEKLKQLPLFDHLAELRRRIVLCAVFFTVALALCWSFRANIYAAITAPLADALKASGQSAEFIYTGITEGFSSLLAIALKAALCVSLPFFAIEGWLYIAPGLYKDERRRSAPYLLAAPALFVCGLAFAYCFVLPAAFDFLIGFPRASNLETPLVLMAKLPEYIDLATSLLFAFGLCFLIPLALVLCIRLGIVSRESLAKGRKFWLVASFVAGAALTPPDIMSQIMLAIPLYLMLEAALLITRRNPK
jgi:sec-independent protein translocase protein TatC